ncbi:hypothetical protein M5D96_001292, partial [Drosophila gunungcola]
AFQVHFTRWSQHCEGKFQRVQMQKSEIAEKTQNAAEKY